MDAPFRRERRRLRWQRRREVFYDLIPVLFVLLIALLAIFGVGPDTFP